MGNVSMIDGHIDGMSDKNIIKALQICTSEHLGCEDGCPYLKVECTNSLRKDSFDLINRQKAEIEMLKADIENANKINFQAVSGLSAFAENIRAEAIKEFAERKKEMKKITNYDRIKSMSVEEMAEWLEKWQLGFSPTTEDEKQDFNESLEKLKQWLLQEVRDENTV